MAGSVTPKDPQQYIPVMKYNTTGTYKVLLTDGDGLGLLGYGATVPTDASTGWAIGAVFIHTDGTAGTCLYCNEGTTGSCDFDAVTVG